MKQVINAQSGHTLFIETVDFEQLPANVQGYKYMDKVKTYIVRNWDKDGVVFMYIQKHNSEYVVWYRNGGFWSSCGKTIQSAIDGAQKDGWMYA